MLPLRHSILFDLVQQSDDVRVAGRERLAVKFEIGFSEDFVGPRGELVWGPDFGVGSLDAAP